MPNDTDRAPRAITAITGAQKNAFVSAFRTWAEAERRVMDQANVLAGLYADLGLGGTGLVDGDLTGDNAGLAAADVQAALGIGNQILTEFTTARRAAFNKIGHGAP